MRALGTCGEPDEIKKNTHPENITARVRDQGYAGNDSTKISYSLVFTDVPSGEPTELPFYMNGRGETLAYPAADTIGEYSARFLATDGEGARATLFSWNFTVVPKNEPKLQFASKYLGWAANDTSGLNAAAGYTDVYVAAAGAGSAVSYSLAPPPADLIDSDSVVGDLVYTMTVSTNTTSVSTNTTSAALAGDQLPGKYFVNAVGETLAQPAIVNASTDDREYDTYYTGTLQAQDASGSKPLVIKDWAFRVLRNDIDVDEYGPNEQGCNNGTAVDGNTFDRSFTCDCGATRFEGANCLVPRPVAAAAAAPTDTGPIIGGVVGALVAVLVYAPQAVQFHPGGGQFDFVWLSARTKHPCGACVW